MKTFTIILGHTFALGLLILGIVNFILFFTAEVKDMSQLFIAIGATLLSVIISIILHITTGSSMFSIFHLIDDFDLPDFF